MHSRFDNSQNIETTLLLHLRSELATVLSCSSRLWASAHKVAPFTFDIQERTEEHSKLRKAGM